MSILYRRFFIVAAMIAVMGALGANLIQNTRSTNYRQVWPAPDAQQMQDCQQMHTCKLINTQIALINRDLG